MIYLRWKVRSVKKKWNEGEWMAVDLEKYVTIYVTEDQMEADLFLAEVEDPSVYDVDEIIAYMGSKEQITVGIKASIIMDMINQRIFDKMVTVAFGIPAIDGKDGYYDFKFNTSPSKKPKLLPDGSVDYYNLSLIETVGEGQLIAAYVPKAEGTDGYDIRGHVLPAAKCRDLPPLRGKGFDVSEDGMSYYAQFNGKIELSMGVMTVSQQHVISGDVDLSTGNIDFKGDLEIMGSIKAGMVVKATGNISVNKLVEAAYVEAGKDVLVRGGILGGGKAVISAGNNVYALFIENATVNANNTVQADAIVNCQVNAFSDINIFGKTSTIVGGKLKAIRTIKTRKRGSEVGVTTELVVGIEPECNVTYGKMMGELRDIEQEIEKIEKTIELMNQKPEKDEKLVMQLIRTKIERSAEVYRLREIVTEMNRRIEIGKYAEVIAEDTVYPGVVITIDGLHTHVDDEFKDIVFLRKGDKILTKKYQPD
ncbi:MAG: DUF342 domain-containing protein [Lachnospiraceae bacterium]|nr:DUF342 domain-containing protein [Lachnospiraceae bacterium]